jgi:transcriptional regulator with XRE-family HTH domain
MSNAKQKIEKVSKVLRHLRNSRKVSQQDISLTTGIDRAFISEIENGKKIPSLETLIKITDYFKISLSDFFKLVEKQD